MNAYAPFLSLIILRREFRGMQKNMKRAIAVGLSFTLAVSAWSMNPSESQAAKKIKLSSKQISLAVKKTKKINIKNIKAKKIKKITVKSNKKSVAAVKKLKKTQIKVTAKKAGKATITVKVFQKGKKKATKLTLKVTVKKAATPVNTQKATATPTQTVKQTTAPTQAVQGTDEPDPVPTPRTKPTTRPVNADDGNHATRPSAEPLIDYTQSFDEDMGDWYARYSEDQGNIASLVHTDEAKSGKAMRITGRVGSDGVAHSWNGPALDMSGIGTPGASYKVTFYAKLPSEYSEDLDGDEVNLRVSGAYEITDDSGFTYENYPADTDYPINADEWTKCEVEFTAPASFYSYIFYFETYGGGKFDFIIDELTLTRTAAPAGADLTLDSIKDTYEPYINTVGVATTYSALLDENTLAFIKHHFNSVTMGNSMKPDALVSSKNVLKQSDAKYVLPDAYSTYAANKNASGDVIVPEFSLDEIDKVLKICHDNGIKIRIHSPMWHQQMPKYFFCEQYDEDKPVVTDKNVILAREEMYIRNIYDYILTSPYADAVAAFDVVNEYTHMSNESGAAGSENWWKYSFGTEMKTDCEYVKKAFVWAYEELTLLERTDVSLIYNDYNTYQPAITAQIIELVNNINTKDDINPYGKVCSGVGMQCHMNDSNATTTNLATAISKFAEQGYEIQITELDVTTTGTVTTNTSEADKAEVYAENAAAYGEIMDTILAEKAKGANITSLTIWGTTDATSWRADRAPLLFGTDISDKKPSFDAVINAAKNFGK